MKKAILAFSLTVISSVIAFGQTKAADEYKKTEFFIGYSNGRPIRGSTVEIR